MESLANFTPNIMENHGNFFQVLANNPAVLLRNDCEQKISYDWPNPINTRPFRGSLILWG